MTDASWLEQIFSSSQPDRPVDLHSAAADLDGTAALELITRLFTSCGQTFTPFADDAIAAGLRFVLGSGQSQWRITYSIRSSM